MKKQSKRTTVLAREQVISILKKELPRLRKQKRRKLFFCQIEAVETVVYLTEILPKNPKGITIPSDLPLESDLAKRCKLLRRYGCKIATGSGKAMLAAWPVINNAQYRQDRRFSPRPKGS